MFYSKQLNLLFVAAPKTGSMSVQSYLSKLDPNGERFRITLEDRIIDSSHVGSASLGHSTAMEFRQALGAEYYDSTRTFGFVRHPIEKLVSTYNFLRQYSLIATLKMSAPKSKWLLVTRQLISIISAKVLPFTIWAFLFPMKKCSHYFLDSSGRVMVDYLGATDRLEVDLVAILEKFGISVGDQIVPHVNKSSYKRDYKYVKSGGLLEKYLANRYRADLSLYELVKDGYLGLENPDIVFVRD